VVRLFVALTPPAEIVENLASAIAPVRLRAPGLRWTPTEQWHVTIAFFGEVSEDSVDKLTNRLRRTAARHPPLSLTFTGGGRFGHRVLWTAVHGDRDGLRALSDSAKAAARRCGLPVEQRPHRPHLTLARAGAGVDLRPLVTLLATWRGLPWVAHQLQLIRSHLGAAPDGTALHEPIRHWALGE
jgi:RNA 2',3'-cyclic 3'-phosphodiesterase